MYIYTIVSIVWSNWWNIDQIFYNITWIKKTNKNYKKTTELLE